MNKIISLTLVLLMVILLSARQAFSGVAEGIALSDTGNYVGAEAEFRTVLKTAIGLDAVEPQFRLGMVLKAQGKLDEAIAQFALVLKTPGATWDMTGNAAFYTGDCLLVQQKFDEAIVAYGKVAGLAIGSPDLIAWASFNSGIANEALKKPAEAQALFKSILFIKNARPDIYLMALNKIDLVLMSVTDTDAYLVKAYRTVTNKQAQDKDGNFIYAEYLQNLLENMSLATQATIIK